MPCPVDHLICECAGCEYEHGLICFEAGRFHWRAVVQIDKVLQVCLKEGNHGSRQLCITLNRVALRRKNRLSAQKFPTAMYQIA